VLPNSGYRNQDSEYLKDVLSLILKHHLVPKNQYKAAMIFFVFDASSEFGWLHTFEIIEADSGYVNWMLAPQVNSLLRS